MNAALFSINYSVQIRSSHVPSNFNLAVSVRDRSNDQNCHRGLHVFGDRLGHRLNILSGEGKLSVRTR
jgi:hypothetical protein